MQLENIKAIEVDMDGTIFLPEQCFSKEMIETFKKIKQENLIFVVNTGRGVYKGIEILKEFDVLKYVDFILGSNGIEIYDVKKESLKVLSCFDKRVIYDLCEKYKNEDISLCVYEGRNILTNKITSQYIDRARETKSDELLFDYKNNLKQYPKMIGIIKAEDFPHFHKLLKEDDDIRYNMNFSTSYLCEITPSGTSKYLGSKKLFEDLDIKENEVISFGDGENDIYMMGGEKIKVAMGHAPKALKDVCDYVTSDIYHDGVKEFLDSYVFKK